MKPIRSAFPWVMILLFTVFGFACTASRSTSDSRKGYQVKNLLNSGNYQFKALHATPLGGKQVVLTTEYFLKVSLNRIEAHLPFFGEAYFAPIGPGETGVKFTSSDFVHDISESKSGWIITIEPNDTRDVQKLSLTVTKSGSATLHVSSNYKQSISYTGNIVKI